MVNRYIEFETVFGDEQIHYILRGQIIINGHLNCFGRTIENNHRFVRINTTKYTMILFVHFPTNKKTTGDTNNMNIAVIQDLCWWLVFIETTTKIKTCLLTNGRGFRKKHLLNVISI